MGYVELGGSPSPPLRRLAGFDVHVQAQEVFRVVLVLHLNQAIVVASIGFTDVGFAGANGQVDVKPARAHGLDGGPGVVGEFSIGRAFSTVSPMHICRELIQGIAVRKSRCIGCQGCALSALDRKSVV